jgi:NAD(P)-dependent dehydrogenase (short-subunit alcohol dehydrogenase family)
MNVFITGASRGIGQALAKEYASLGARMVLAARNVEQLRELCEEINKKPCLPGGQTLRAPGKASYIQCDVTKRDEVSKAAEFAAEMMGTIDIAILNSGTSHKNWASNFDSELFKETIETNLFGVAYGLEFFVPLMLRQGYGKIVGVSSLAGERGFPGSGAYSSSKAAVTRLLESARVDLKKYGIKVITVKPGFIRTDMTAKNEFGMPFLMQPEKAAKIIRRGIEKNKSVIQFPLGTVILTKITRMLPNFLFDAIARKVRPENR